MDPFLLGATYDVWQQPGLLLTLTNNMQLSATIVIRALQPGVVLHLEVPLRGDAGASVERRFVPKLRAKF